MNIHITINDAAMCAAMSGEIDHHSADELREKVDKAYERSGCRHMIFDFTRVTFMDSSGIGMIIGRYKMTEKRGGLLSIVGMNDEVSRIFTISGLAKIIRSYATAEEAMQNITGR